ncbi:patatin-like phospholipase family protein [Polaromonas sp.]|uniref:patatin-like phospholipase family protein n=1 Tax=Polaromonas sp. TaxID=1869339 RepID=UPI002FC9B3C7
MAWGAAALLLAGCTVTPPSPPSQPATAVQTTVKRPPRLGLALGGGAARGFAHVGVIAALEEAGLKPDLVVGTSAGSLVAALYASGKSSAQLQQTALNMEEVAITDWMLPIVGRGMFRGDALARYVNDLVAGRLIENMRIPLGIVATDLGSGQAMLFQRGDTGTAVRASSAVPAVFVPVKINDREYVDGGLVSPVPVRFARQMGAELVIAVDISSPPEANPAGGTLQILLQTFAIMGKSINQYELKEADVVVRPSQVGLKSADFSARQRAIDAGRAAMQAALPALRARLEALAVPAH